MNNDLSKSPEMLQREAAIKKLQQQLKSRKSTLKGLKTRLTNNKEEIEDIQYKSSTQIFSAMERMGDLKKEIVELAKKMLKIKGLTKEDSMALQDMVDSLEKEDMHEENFRAYQEQKEEYLENGFSFEEGEKAKIRDLFEGVHVKPDEQEQKDIRKIFVKLSNKFHPDRARTEKEAKEFHEMQQKLNNAYQNGDIQTLLEMERLLLTDEIDLSDPKAYTVDILQQAIDRLEKELSFIDNQILRVRQEIKNLKNSDLGDMLTGLRKAKREGHGIDDSIKHLEEGIEMFTNMRDALKESVEMGEISPKFMEFAMRGSSMGSSRDIGDVSPEEMMDMLAEMMGNDGKGMEDMFEMFSHDMEEDLPENTKFKLGQSVKITKAIKHPRAKKISLKNCVGRIIDVYYNSKGQLEYEVSLDSISLSSLPAKVISDSIESEEDFQDIDAILEKHLVACPPRDTEGDSMASYRKLLHQYKWAYLPKTQAKRLQNILLVSPEKPDDENWLNYLEKLDFPLNAVSMGLLSVPAGMKVKILGIKHMDNSDGIIVEVKIENEEGLYPLYDLMAADTKSALYNILDDYNRWYADYHDGNNDPDDFFF